MTERVSDSPQTGRVKGLPLGTSGLVCEVTCLNSLYHSRYRYGQLIEINSHSLFSKWFSEVSINKLILRLVNHVNGKVYKFGKLSVVLTLWSEEHSRANQ